MRGSNRLSAPGIACLMGLSLIGLSLHGLSIARSMPSIDQLLQTLFPSISVYVEQDASSESFYQVPTGMAKSIGGNVRPESERTIAGKVLRRTYEFAQRSRFELAYKMLSNSLANNAQGKLLYECLGVACGPSSLWVSSIFEAPRITGLDDQQALWVIEQIDQVDVLYLVQRGNRQVYLHHEQVRQPNDASTAQTKSAPALEFNSLEVLHIVPANWQVQAVDQQKRVLNDAYDAAVEQWYARFGQQKPYVVISQGSGDIAPQLELARKLGSWLPSELQPRVVIPGPFAAQTLTPRKIGITIWLVAAKR